MKYNIVFSICVFLSFTSVKSSAIATNNKSVFGSKIDPITRTLNQAKRDLSLSYAATNIDSKEGTRVKTITVIRNIGKPGKSDKLSINPELHKSEEWATAFRDNFDSYGVIPDVPDIDDLFDFVNKKKPNEGKAPESKPQPPPKKPTNKDSPGKDEKPVHEPSAEEVALKESDVPVEKIKGDAELLPSSASGGDNKPPESRLRSQSLSADNKSARLRTPLVNVNYSTPQHSVYQRFDKYIQQNTKGYDYPKPCQHAVPVSSINVSTPSGRTYDIPVGNGSRINPYIAPAITNKGQLPPPLPPQQQNNNPQNYPNTNPTYSVNSLVPPLQSASGVVVNAQSQSTQPQQQQPFFPFQPQVSQQQNGGFSTSQRPYVAPKLRNDAAVSPKPAPTPIYNSSPTNFRSNVFGFSGAKKPNTARSRGLKY